MTCDTRREATGELEEDTGAGAGAAGAAVGRGREDGGTEFKSGAMTVKERNLKKRPEGHASVSLTMESPRKG
jgi:hypothetical protein